MFIMGMEAKLDELRFLDLHTVSRLTSLSRTQINRYRSQGRFPVAVSLGVRRIGFVESEIRAWIADRIAERVDSEGRAA